MTANETLTRLANLIGPEQLARLRYSIPETIEKGRLRHWQEQLLSTVADELGVKIETADQLQELFVNAEGVAVPITREQFLGKPYDYFHNEHVVIDDSWIQDAWTAHSLRGSISYELARSVSKTGGFGLAANTLMRIAPILDETNAIELYVYIRDESNRIEQEWRNEFVDAFPNVDGKLPSPQS